MRRLACALLAFLLLAAFTDDASARRVALVVGNSAYKNVTRLPNPANDARAMADTLTRLGFETVSLKLDQDFTTFRRSLRSFARKAAGAELGLVFFAGHGIEVDGQNYLIPVDAELTDASDVDFEAIPLSTVMAALDRVKKLKLVVLDACRDNPFSSRMKTAGATRSIGRGLARVNPRGQNSLVAYAAREGTVARDGDGKHSPYVTALLAHIETPGLEIGFLFRKVRDAVVEKTGGQQEPFVYGSLSGEAIYLKGATSLPAPPKPTTTTPTPLSPNLGATMAWEHVKDAKDVDLLRAFIAQYGASNPFYARLAERRISELEKEKKTAAVPPVSVRPPETTRPSGPASPQHSGKPYSIEGQCQTDFDNWKRKAGIGVFAVEKGGGCGWSYGYKSLPEARNRALAECRNQGPDCLVFGITPPKSGQWSVGANCRRDLANWRKKASIAAFALERGGGCGWSFGFDDVVQARSRALDECANQGPNCEIMEIHTHNAGDFKLGAACRDDLVSWRKKASIGAFAAERRGGCGWSWANKTVAAARSAALEACRKRGPECKVIEVHTKQRGDWTLSDTCKTRLVEWRRLKRKGAFAVERGGGCGWSYGFNSIKQAESRAIVECRKQGPECKVFEVR